MLQFKRKLNSRNYSCLYCPVKKGRSNNRRSTFLGLMSVKRRFVLCGCLKLIHLAILTWWFDSMCEIFVSLHASEIAFETSFSLAICVCVVGDTCIAGLPLSLGYNFFLSSKEMNRKVVFSYKTCLNSHLVSLLQLTAFSSWVAVVFPF